MGTCLNPPLPHHDIALHFIHVALHPEVTLRVIYGLYVDVIDADCALIARSVTCWYASGLR